MPSLIRLLITLLFLGGLVYAGMFALVTFVEPTPKEVNQRIPTRELLGETEAARPGANNLPQPNVTSQPSTGQ
ncbi:hypothetical protein SAMN06295905_3621 [Devosia lucknowensis]|uniref:Histidine kinase n=1 Tax=Devosia lucknowensis TaxID=1096929 RepID=A0A1Y6GCX0_9HYPH|nr:hypothetical protein SAMN06295905_3621 [Devosia lucknowensis]